MKNILAIALLATSICFAQADTFTLNASADARILSIFPDQNFQTDILSTYNFPGNEQRTVIQFDLSTFASNTTVGSATLRLHGGSLAGPTQTVSVFRTTQAWEESQVTWNQHSTGNAWTNAGGDFVGINGIQNSDPYSSTLLTYVGSDDWREFDVTSLVQEWIAGTYSNYGMTLTGSEQAGFIYVQRDTTASPNIPQLIINTEAVPEPVTMLIALPIAAIVLRRKR